MFTDQAALKLVKEANNKLNSLFAFLNDFRYEEAIEKYEGAINIFKYLKKYEDAAQVWDKIIEIHMKRKDNLIYDSYIGAGNCYKISGNNQKYVEYTELAIGGMVLRGSFSRVAKISRDLAEYLEKIKDYTKALKYYEQSKQFYGSENSPSLAASVANCKAELLTFLKRYGEAFTEFESLYVESVAHKLHKYGSIDYAYQGVLCLLAIPNNLGNVKNKLIDFSEVNANFDSSREYKFIIEIIDSMENQDVESFQKVLRARDAINKFSQRETNILIDIKNNIPTANYVFDLDVT